MRLFVTFLLVLLVIASVSFAETADVQPVRPAPVRAFFVPYLKTPALQLSLFSYKPSLAGLTDLLQTLGVSQVPGELLTTLSLRFEHTARFASRVALGYWQMDLDVPLPSATRLSATLIPVSYQLLYRPVLLSEYLPIYVGGGIGVLGTRFSGTTVELLEAQGIDFSGSGSGLTGFLLIGADLLAWADRVSLNLEVKRILKTVETTGATPLNLVLDGSAIGVGATFRF